MRFIKHLMLASLLGIALPVTATTLAPVGTTDDGSASQPTQVHKVRGFLPDLRFSLIGPGEQAVTEENFRGKVVMMFFGYSSCPDICPTTMAQLSQVMHLLADDAQKVRILFVSVDPHRDTSEKLQTYVRAFDTHAIGLTGTEQQVAQVARRYRVAYQIEKPRSDNPDNYEVAHSRGVYIFDGNGKAAILASDSESVEALTESVRPLLETAR